MALVVFSAGCSTRHFKSVPPADVVAACIADKWKDCGMSGFKIPVTIERQTNGYLVGIAMGTVWHGLPSGAKHPGYVVWAEVMDTDTGSNTEYHRAYQIVHGCIDRGVVDCQDKPQ
jgi:hypothetical protein